MRTVFARVYFLFVFTPQVSYAQSYSGIAQTWVLYALVASLITVIIAPPGTKLIWAVGVTIGIVGSTVLYGSAYVLGMNFRLFDASRYAPLLFFFWIFVFFALVFTRIRYWQRTGKLPK